MTFFCLFFFTAPFSSSWDVPPPLPPPSPFSVVFSSSSSLSSITENEKFDVTTAGEAPPRARTEEAEQGK